MHNKNSLFQAPAAITSDNLPTAFVPTHICGKLGNSVSQLELDLRNPFPAEIRNFAL
jgi:hypothetical protein